MNSENMSKNFYRAKASDFSKIPGSPIAYWVSGKIRYFFTQGKISDYGMARRGLQTGDSNYFIKYWFELKCSNINDKNHNNNKWFFLNNGGGSTKWFGNNILVVNWYNKGYEIKSHISSIIPSEHLYGKKAITWSKISSKTTNFRYQKIGIIPGDLGPCLFIKENDKLMYIFGILNSVVRELILKIIAPTVTKKTSDIEKFPVRPKSSYYDVNDLVKQNISLSKSDWDLRETSWDFRRSPLITDYLSEPIETVIDENLTDISWPSLVLGGKWGVDSKKEVVSGELGVISKKEEDSEGQQLPTSHYTLSTSYSNFTTFWTEQFKTLHKNEEELNRIFIDLYELQDELTPDVPYNEITILQSELESKALKENKLVFKKDEILRQFVSYAVGCIFGRYSLDKDGLVLANAGEGIEEYYWIVGSGKWIVDSKDVNRDKDNGHLLTTNHYTLTTPNSPSKTSKGDIHESKKLSGIDSMAESNGSGRDGLQVNKGISKGGTVRIDQSDKTSGSFHSLEHSRGAGAQINSGISSFLINCPRFKSGSGDANPDCPALGICNRQYDRGNFKPGYGDNTSDQRSSEQSDLNSATSTPTTSIHSPQATNYSYFLTNNSSLTTNHCILSSFHFLPDQSGILPITDENDFPNDLTTQFKTFLKASFGHEHFQENLRFVEDAIGKDIRRYLIKDFYKDHVKRYKKRPIYWMISSPSGAFKALIYLHRHTKDTIGIFLNDYLRPYRKKLKAKLQQNNHTLVSADSSTGEKTRAQKKIDQLRKNIKELEDWERDVVYPLATNRIELDLDDGVKVNYAKLGSILEMVKGLNA